MIFDKHSDYNFDQQRTSIGKQPTIGKTQTSYNIYYENVWKYSLLIMPHCLHLIHKIKQYMCTLINPLKGCPMRGQEGELAVFSFILCNWYD